MLAWRFARWSRMRRLNSCKSSRNWTNTLRRNNHETVTASWDHASPRSGYPERSLDLRQQIWRSADQRPLCLHYHQEQCRCSRIAGGGGVACQLEGTAQLDPEAVAGMGWPG